MDRDSNFIVSGQTGIDAKAGKESIRTDKSFVSMPLTEETGVTNNGKESLYAVVSQRYNPAKGEETEAGWQTFQMPFADQRSLITYLLQQLRECLLRTVEYASRIIVEFIGKE